MMRSSATVREVQQSEKVNRLEKFNRLEKIGNRRRSLRWKDRAWDDIIHATLLMPASR
jgi:hypothetical protein